MSNSDEIIRVGQEIPEVASVKTQMPYKLIVTFEDGTCRETLLNPDDMVGLMAALKDPDYFARAFVDARTKTVAWPNGVDLDPCVLYEPSLRTKVKRNHIDKTQSISSI